MNNNLPNNNNENNNDLNAVSLGDIDTGNINSVPPVSPIDTLNMDEPSNTVASSPQVNNSIPPVDSTPVSTGVGVSSSDSMGQGVNTPVNPIPPVEPVSYDIPETINNFNTTPVFNEIGTVPPIPSGPVQTPPVTPEAPKPKKKQNKLIFVLILVLLIAAVGVGVYIFLNMSNGGASVSVTPKNVEIEVGSQISTNIEDYATFNGVASSSCSLDTSNITDTSVIGAEYSFSITCNGVTYNGTAVVVDTTAPVVVLKEVTVQVNGSVAPEDFIDTCTDESSCSYEFSDANTVNGYLANIGNYHVDIIVRDEAGNEETVTATLMVVEEEVPDLYLSCSMNNETVRLGITSSTFTGNAVRTYTFTLSESEYNTFKSQNENSAEVTYQNITGAPSFDDTTFTLTLMQNLTKAQLDQETGSTLPTAYGDLNRYFENSLGYDCLLEQP